MLAMTAKLEMLVNILKNVTNELMDFFGGTNYSIPPNCLKNKTALGESFGRFWYFKVYLFYSVRPD